MSDFISTSLIDNSKYKTQINLIKNINNSNSLFAEQLSSFNFDGAVNKDLFYVAASEVSTGQYIIPTISSSPTAIDSPYLVYAMTSNYDYDSQSSSIYFYYLDANFNISIIGGSAKLPSDMVWVIKENWLNKNPGKSGWLITPEGNAIFSNIHARGIIEANSGYIGGANGWSILSGQLFAGQGNYAVGLSTSSISIYAGSETASAAPFYVTNTGNLFAQNANITGSISTGYGDIAGFVVDPYQLRKGVSKNLLSQYDPGFETKWSTYYTDFETRTSPPGTGTVSGGKVSTAVIKKFGFSSGGLTIFMSGAPDARVGITSNFFLPVSSNTQYTYSIYIYDPSAIIDNLTASFYNSASTLISSASPTISTTASWGRYSYTFTTSSTTAYIKYGLLGATSGDGFDAQQTVYFDGVQIELGASPTSWDIDSNIRLVSNAQNDEDPFRIYITENTSASTVLLALNPNGILQSRYLRVNPFGDAGAISTTNYDHAFQIGTSSAQHIRMDNSGIQSILTSSYSYYDPALGGSATAYLNTGSTLYVNKFGGDVILGQTTGAYNSNLSVYGSGSFTKGITASNAYVVINGTTVYLGASATVSSSVTAADSLKTYVRNGTASTIYKGQAVYVTGASGTNILVGLADNNAEITSSKTLGLMENDTASSDRNYVITEGLLSGLNTSTATQGDPVWLSASPGELIYGLTNKPYAPNHLVYIGVVTRVSSTNGEIFIKPQNGFELQELHNVSARYPNNNDVLIYNASSSLWQTSGSAPYASNSASFGGVSANDALIAISGSYSIINSSSVLADSWTSSAFSTAEYTLQLKQSSSLTSSKILLAHDNNSTVHWTEHSIIDVNGGISKLLSFTRDNSTGKILLSVTCSGATSASPVKFSFYRFLIST